MNYLCLEYTRGARIGHQSYNYFSSLSICSFYNLQLVYSPFSHSSRHFEDVLSFSNLHTFHYYKNKPNVIEVEPKTAEEVILSKEDSILYKLDLNKSQNVFSKLLEKISRNKTLDFYKEHKEKLSQVYRQKSPYKTKDNLIIHIRRGDAIGMESRIQGLDYFYNVLNTILSSSPIKYNVYITSEPNLENTSIFNEFNPTMLTDKTDIEAFYHMVNADVIVGSPSGFSYLAYILGKGDYYRTPKDWVLYDKNVKVAYK